MDKKLKLNAFVKGVSIFAFVAFCLLAILAGVTLPFVSNASTTDGAVVNAESDLHDSAVASADSNDYISAVNAVVGTTYYGILVPDDNTNKTSTISDYPSAKTLLNFHTLDTNLDLICFSSKATSSSLRTIYLTASINDSRYMYQYLLSCTRFSNEFCYDNGFVFDTINPDVSKLNILVRTVPYSSNVDISDLQNQIATLTSEKNALQVQVDNLTAEKADLQHQISVKQERIDTLTAEKKILEDRVQSLIYDKTDLQNQLTEKQNQIDTLTAEKTALQAQLSEKQNQIDTLTAEKTALQAQLTEKQNQIDTLIAEKTALQTQISNLNFMSHFGNFDNLASSDFYVNLSTDLVLPNVFYSFIDNSTPINGWYLVGEGGGTSIFGLNLFDRFYYNGTQEFGFLNCGFQLTRKAIPSTTIPPTYTIVGKLQFIVYDTVIWSADCDFDYDTTTKVETISNIRNGTFLVSANYDKDTNVYQFTVPDNKLFLLNDNYNKSYDIFRSFVVQQDYKKVKIPSDNALYLNGYQSASKDFYNKGYNKGYESGKNYGFDVGLKSGDAGRN